MRVIKRNGAEVEFDIVKIIAAVTKANDVVDEEARMTPVQIQRIAESVEFSCQSLGRAPTVEEIQATLFASDSKTEALICEIENKVAGYAVFFTSYSTWLGRNGIYMEDLYVSPEFRGNGAGKALLRTIAQLAVKRECGRLEWSVLDWNQPAIDFYLSIGALPQSEWVRYRLDGAALAAFAESGALAR